MEYMRETVKRIPMMSCGRQAPVPALPAKPTGTWLCAIAAQPGRLLSCDYTRLMLLCLPGGFCNQVMF